MMRIHELDPLLSNQIAAGEVIERPASVVKELVENSLDAGATQIKVDVINGGESLIKVTDNGSGIHRDDLVVAFKRHATSKIQSYDDLVHVNSLGFRGEALASIAAVSRVKLTSCVADAENGFMIKNNLQGEIESPSIASHPVGTTIEIADLFYQTPARRKFLRKERTEFNYIETMLQRLALSHFHVGFQLTHNQKEIMDTRAAVTKREKENRLKRIFGDDFIQHALHISYETPDFQLEGWIADPTFTRAQADMQYFYVNGRFVRDKLVMHAVKEAYRDVLFHGRHPVFILYLAIDPANVDVNVHPTKHEVRFRESQSVHGFIRRGIKEALAQIRPAQSLTLESSKLEDPVDEVATITAPVSTTAYQKTFPAQNNTSINQSVLKAQKQWLDQSIVETETMIKVPPLGYAVAQIHNTYIVAENEKGMVLVDMHAAHERILYEKLKKQISNNALPIQQLLIPLSLQLTAQEMHAFEQHDEVFKKLGFEIDMIGASEIVVRTVPAQLGHKDISLLIKDTLSDLIAQTESTRIESLFNHLLGTIACHAALRAPHVLSVPEMNEILRQMEETQNSGCCNHGRPTWRQFSFTELDKCFLRGQ